MFLSSNLLEGQIYYTTTFFDPQSWQRTFRGSSPRPRSGRGEASPRPRHVRRHMRRVRGKARPRPSLASAPEHICARAAGAARPRRVRRRPRSGRGEAKPRPSPAPGTRAHLMKETTRSYDEELRRARRSMGRLRWPGSVRSCSDAKLLAATSLGSLLSLHASLRECVRASVTGLAGNGLSLYERAWAALEHDAARD